MDDNSLNNSLSQNNFAEQKLHQEVTNTNQSSVSGAEIQPTQNDGVVKKIKKRFFIILVTWLFALPVALALSIYSRIIYRDAPDAVMAFINITTILLGFYALLGWILLIIFGTKWSSLSKK